MMLEELQRRHYSEATTRRYIRFIERFAQHFHRSPDRLGPQHIREYQAHLFTQQKLSPGSVTNHLCALRFFYIQTLKIPWSIAATPTSMPTAMPELRRVSIPTCSVTASPRICWKPTPTCIPSRSC